MTDCKSRVHWVTRQISINEKTHWDPLYLIQVTESPIWFLFFLIKKILLLSFSRSRLIHTIGCVCFRMFFSSLTCAFHCFSVCHLPNIPRRTVKSILVVFWNEWLCVTYAHNKLTIFYHGRMSDRRIYIYWIPRYSTICFSLSFIRRSFFRLRQMDWQTNTNSAI